MDRASRARLQRHLDRRERENASILRWHRRVRLARRVARLGTGLRLVEVFDQREHGRVLVIRDVAGAVRWRGRNTHDLAAVEEWIDAHSPAG